MLHGDAYLQGGGFDVLPDLESMHSALKNQEYRNDDEATKNPAQGWTYLADYTFHPLLPRRPADVLFIHAMITKKGVLRFAVFDQIQTADMMNKTPLAMVSDRSTAQVLHGEFCSPRHLRIASKTEAEQYMLKDSKLIRQTAPKYAGMLVNCQRARIGVRHPGGIGSLNIAIYGHIWVYFYTIADNVLYFIGIPLYQGGDKGRLIYGNETYKLTSLPPHNMTSCLGMGIFLTVYRHILEPLRKRDHRHLMFLNI